MNVWFCRKYYVINIVTHINSSLKLRFREGSFKKGGISNGHGRLQRRVPASETPPALAQASRPTPTLGKTIKVPLNSGRGSYH